MSDRQRFGLAIMVAIAGLSQLVPPRPESFEYGAAYFAIFIGFAMLVMPAKS